MSTLPGRRTPSESETSRDTISLSGVAIDAAGVTDIQRIVGDRVKVVDVVVDPTQSDFQFNVNNNGNAVFAADQSPDDANEDNYIPDSDDKEAAGVDASTVSFEVTAASGTGGASADVQVVVESEDAIR